MDERERVRVRCETADATRQPRAADALAAAMRCGLLFAAEHTAPAYTHARYSGHATLLRRSAALFTMPRRRRYAMKDDD